jgi:urea transport system ATP-binding protein
MGKGWRLLGVLLGVLGVVSLVGLSLAQGLAQGEVKVGVLHSLTGLVEQKLEFAWNFAQRFYIMDWGRVILEGRTSEASPETVGRLISL